MKPQKLLIFTLFLILAFSSGFAQELTAPLTEYSISTDQLKEWQLLGEGEVSVWGKQLSLKESENSKGVMLISPQVYEGDIIVKYNVLALTPATVIVTMLSMSDQGESDSLTIPEDYDGSIGLWNKNKESYFYAFKNAPHGVTPFVRKNPNSSKSLAAAEKNIMIAGVSYDVEIGKVGNKLWLTIDGEKIFKSEDENPFAAGKIAIRLRGTAGFPAGCLVRDFIVMCNKQ